jgi:hypothetical protein
MLRHLPIYFAFVLLMSACRVVPHSSVTTESKPGVIATDQSSANGNARAVAPAGYGPPVLLANLENTAVNESSGIAASRRSRDLFWTHNDSGDGPFIYAFDRKGRQRGTWRVAFASARDWEDIAVGPGPDPKRSYIYVGDIGDNGRQRNEIIVYRVVEPQTSAGDISSSKKNPLATEQARPIRLAYPDGKHNAEALLVHPKTGALYIVTKNFGSSCGVYKAPAKLSATINTLVRVGEVSIPTILGGAITGGDISPDGLKVILCDYLAGYEIALPADHTDFDLVWRLPLTRVELGSRRQGEAVCYSADGSSLLVTSEGLPCPLIEVPRVTDRK